MVHLHILLLPLPIVRRFSRGNGWKVPFVRDSENFHSGEKKGRGGLDYQNTLPTRKVQIGIFNKYFFTKHLMILWFYQRLVFTVYTRKAWCCVVQIFLCNRTVFLGFTFPFFIKQNKTTSVWKSLLNFQQKNYKISICPKPANVGG